MSMKNKGLALLLAFAVFVGCAFAIQNAPGVPAPDLQATEAVSSVAAEPKAASELAPENKEKIDGWKYRPEDEIYLAYKEVFDNPEYYNQQTGEIVWPPNDGAVEGTTEQIVLPAGTRIDRYGSEDGFFTSPAGTPYEQRSCAPGSDQKPYHQYEVLKPIEGVVQGVTAPWFDEPGGGLQYMMPMSIQELLDQGYLKSITE